MLTLKDNSNEKHDIYLSNIAKYSKILCYKTVANYKGKITTLQWRKLANTSLTK